MSRWGHSPGVGGGLLTLPWLFEYRSEAEVIARARDLSDRWAALDRDVAVWSARGQLSDELVELARNEREAWANHWQQCSSTYFCRASGSTYDEITGEWTQRFNRVYERVKDALPPGAELTAPPPLGPQYPWWLKGLAFVGGALIVTGIGYAAYVYFSGPTKLARRVTRRRRRK